MKLGCLIQIMRLQALYQPGINFSQDTLYAIFATMDIIEELYKTVFYFKDHVSFLFMWLGIIWGVHILNLLFGRGLLIFGILPRTIPGILGIFLCPFLHGSFNHLFFNSIPLFVLGGLVLLKGKLVFYTVSLTIIILSGLVVWLVGRKAIHVGASGLIMGYFGYLIVLAFKQPSASTIFVVIICLYYFGGLISDLVPHKEEVSWEAHVFGFFAGILSVFTTPYVFSYL